MPTVQISNDRLKAALARVLQSLIGSRLDFQAYYPGVATNQNADGTLDVIPDDPRIPSVQGVPIRYGVPGVSATIANGARVLLGFAGGDPSKPIATVWESASVTSLTITATAIKLGGSSAAQKLVLGTTYATDATSLATAMTALAAALTTLGANMVAGLPGVNATAAATACTAAATAATNAATAATALASDVSTHNTTL